MTTYTDRYGNPCNALQAWGVKYPEEGGSEPTAAQIDAFERDPEAQARDDRRRDAEWEARERYTDEPDRGDD